MADKPNNCKIVLLGESGVGKTCIISRYVNGTYDDKSESTNGASYASKTIEIQGRNLNIHAMNDPSTVLLTATLTDAQYNGTEGLTLNVTESGWNCVQISHILGTLA